MSRVMVIDDSEEFREVVADLLRDVGHEVVVVGTPEEAQKEWRAKPFDLVFCDLVMPVDHSEHLEEESESAMVGVHAIHEFTQEFPGVPIVAVSGKLTGPPLKAVDKFGATAALSKPFSRQELLDVVTFALKGPQN